MNLRETLNALISRDFKTPLADKTTKLFCPPYLCANGQEPRRTVSINTENYLACSGLFISLVGKNLGFFPKDKTTKLFCPPNPNLFALDAESSEDSFIESLGDEPDLMGREVKIFNPAKIPTPLGRRRPEEHF